MRTRPTTLTTRSTRVLLTILTSLSTLGLAHHTCNTTISIIPQSPDVLTILTMLIILTILTIATMLTVLHHTYPNHHMRCLGFRFEVVSFSPRLAAGAVEASVAFPSVEAGTTLHVRQWATNRAGLASVIESAQLIVVDDTPPTHPVVWGCTPSGRLVAHLSL